MKVEKFKVLLYLKKSGLDKSGKAPIMGRITVNRTMAQFGSKLSCTPELWNPRESRLNGKSKEAVETNARIEKLLLAVNAAFDSLVSRKVGFDATDVKNHFQGSMETQMTLMKMTDAICDDIKARIGIDRAKGTYPGYHYMRLTLGEFIETKYKVKDLAFGQLTEQFIHDYQTFVMEEKGYAIDTVRHHLAILKKICRLAYKKGYSEKCHFQHFALPRQSERTPRALSRESFERIRDVEIPPYRKTHILARDLFLFACYTGVSYADVVSITDENLYTDDNGSLWLKYRRKKNEHRASVKL
ncbi:phage integrase SAM-like domain-containing protein, partial [uncultured Bacteroides sp.]|uniref:phage integrase SAM-like domain-containing protein n=1 Tax=uncultured Bacteroides sp. TaxID=162156 RepID=UPI00259241FF